MSKIGTFVSILKNIGLAAAEAGLSQVGLAELASKLHTPAPPPNIIPQKLQDIWDLVKRSEFISAVLKDVTLTGPQKRAMIVPEVTRMVLAIDDFAGHNPEDPAEFAAGIDDLVSAIVRIGNSYKKK